MIQLIMISSNRIGYTKVGVSSSLTIITNNFISYGAVMFFIDIRNLFTSSFYNPQLNDEISFKIH